MSRSRTGGTPGRVLIALATGLLTTAVMSGCADSGTQVTAVPLDTRSYPVVDAGQAGSILQAVDATRVRGVDSRDRTVLDSRIVGPFRQLTLAQEKTSTALKRKVAPPAAVKRVALLVPISRTWPRFFVAVGDTRDESTYVLQVLTSPDARSPYGLWGQPALLPGATLPEVAPMDVGAPAIAPDAPGLVMPPSAVLRAYADYLNSTVRSPAARQFQRSTFSDQLSTGLTKDRASLKAVANVTSRQAPVPGEPVARASRNWSRWPTSGSGTTTRPRPHSPVTTASRLSTPNGSRTMR